MRSEDTSRRTVGAFLRELGSDLVFQLRPYVKIRHSKLRRSVFHCSEQTRPIFTVRIENISRRNGECNIFTGGVRMYCERLPGPAGLAVVTVPGTISRRVYMKYV